MYRTGSRMLRWHVHTLRPLDYTITPPKRCDIFEISNFGSYPIIKFLYIFDYRLWSKILIQKVQLRLPLNLKSRILILHHHKSQTLHNSLYLTTSKTDWWIFVNLSSQLQYIPSFAKQQDWGRSRSASVTQNWPARLLHIKQFTKPYSLYDISIWNLNWKNSYDMHNRTWMYLSI